MPNVFACSGVAQQRAATAELHVIRVNTDCQYVNFHEYVTFV
jgi:hypothetical protein